MHTIISRSEIIIKEEETDKTITAEKMTTWTCLREIACSRIVSRTGVNSGVDPDEISHLGTVRAMLRKRKERKEKEKEKEKKRKRKGKKKKRKKRKEKKRKEKKRKEKKEKKRKNEIREV